MTFPKARNETVVTISSPAAPYTTPRGATFMLHAHEDHSLVLANTLAVLPQLGQLLAQLLEDRRCSRIGQPESRDKEATWVPHHQPRGLIPSSGIEAHGLHNYVKGFLHAASVRNLKVPWHGFEWILKSGRERGGSLWSTCIGAPPSLARPFDGVSPKVAEIAWCWERKPDAAMNTSVELGTSASNTPLLNVESLVTQNYRFFKKTKTDHIYPGTVLIQDHPKRIRNHDGLRESRLSSHKPATKQLRPLFDRPLPDGLPSHHKSSTPKTFHKTILANSSASDWPAADPGGENTGGPPLAFPLSLSFHYHGTLTTSRKALDIRPGNQHMFSAGYCIQGFSKKE
ncbi:hypothetical protein H4582DRAFT_2213492 [Lactarius indigo]|nr:hypothetical protein H4582DRAFT_2213492 [Lactarius indigo]